MKRRKFIGLTGAAITGASIAGNTEPSKVKDINKKIFIFGGGFHIPFISYLAKLTGKTSPRLCFLPTASADNPYAINAWYQQCAELDVKPFVQRMFISSYN